MMVTWLRLEGEATACQQRYCLTALPELPRARDQPHLHVGQDVDGNAGIPGLSGGVGWTSWNCYSGANVNAFDLLVFAPFVSWSVRRCADHLVGLDLAHLTRDSRPLIDLMLPKGLTCRYYSFFTRRPGTSYCLQGKYPI